ncbi:MAG: Ig domain-containing protein [PVC group bacterium]
MKKSNCLFALVTAALILGGVRPAAGEFFPYALPENESFLLTTNYVDQDFIYNVYEQYGSWGPYNQWQGYYQGYIEVYDHSFNHVGTIPAESLFTDTTLYSNHACHEIQEIASNDEYLYIGTSQGYLVQVDKETLERTGWCLFEYDVTGIVPMDNGYVYAATYFGPGPGHCEPGSDQFYKVDPDGMEVVAGFWAPDSTHSLATDGEYLYTTTCGYGYDPDLEWGNFEGEVEGGLVLMLDPITMEGVKIFSAGTEELGNAIVVIDKEAYFLDVTDWVYKLDLTTGTFTPLVKVPGLYVRRMFYAGNRLYFEDEVYKNGAPGYYRMDLAEPGQIEHLDAGESVFSVCIFDRKLYISYGHELEIKDINRPPVFDDFGPYTIYEGEPLAFKVQAVDPDGDELTYEVIENSLPPGATFDSESGEFSWTPSPGQSSEIPYMIMFIAADGWGGTAGHTVLIQVNWKSKYQPVPKTRLKKETVRPDWHKGIGKFKPPIPEKARWMDLPVEAPPKPFPPIPGPDPDPRDFKRGKP